MLGVVVGPYGKFMPTIHSEIVSLVTEATVRFSKEIVVSEILQFFLDNPTITAVWYGDRFVTQSELCEYNRAAVYLNLAYKIADRIVLLQRQYQLCKSYARYDTHPIPAVVCIAMSHRALAIRLSSQLKDLEKTHCRILTAALNSLLRDAGL